MSDILENRMMLIIYTMGVMFFLLRVIAIVNGDTAMYDDPKYIEASQKMQGIMELLITVSFIWVVIPRWFNKVRNTPLNKLVSYGCMFIGMAVLFVMLPEVTGKEIEFTTMKPLGILVCLAITGIFWLIAYWYGKKYKSEKKEEIEDEEKREDESERCD